MANDDEIGINLKLRGGKIVSAELNKVSSDIKNLKQSAFQTSAELQRFNSTLGSGIQSAAGFAVRGAAAGTAALTGMAAAASYMGVKTAASFEQSEIAFGVLLKSTDRARDMMADLRTFAENSPFALKDVTTGAQRLKAMGFAAEEIMPMLKTLGNAASSGIVGTEEGLNRLTYAFGQIKAAGRLQGDEIRQLEEMGINVREALSKGFGIPKEELPKAIREGKLEGTKAIGILTAAIDKDMGGMMDKQSKSWAGMWSRAKEVAQNTTGDIARSLMDPFKPQANKALAWAEAQGKKVVSFATSWANSFALLQGKGMDGFSAAIASLDMVTGSGGKLESAAKSVQGFFTDMNAIWTGSLQPALSELGPLLQPIESSLGVLRGAIGFMADHPDAGKVFFEGMAIAITSYGLVALIRGVAGAILGVNSAIRANPLFFLASAAIFVMQALGHLADTINGKSIPAWQSFIGYLGPVGFMISILEGKFHFIETGIDRARRALEFFSEKFAAFKKLISEGVDVKGAGIGLKLPSWSDITGNMGKSGGVPGQAAGGVTTSSGLSWVGERGPELLSLPTGATVRPLEGDEGSISMGETHLHAHVSGNDALHAERAADILLQRLGTMVARA